MLISSLLQSSIQKQGNVQSSNPCQTNGILASGGSLPLLPCDTFQKTSSVGAVSKVSENSQNEKIERLYNETYNIVVEQNPMFKELNIPKPDLVCNSEDLEEGTLARYTCLSNSIKLNKNINEDWYILIAKDEEGKDIPFTIEAESDLDEAISKLKDDTGSSPNVTKVKLSDKEKELWQKSMIAHELRHCLQFHSTASLNGGLSLANRFEAAKSLIELQRTIVNTQRGLVNLYTENGKITNIEEYNKQAEEYNKQLSKLQDLEKGYGYIVNFKPHKILDDSATLKFSLDPSDTREWSIKEHFDKAVGRHERENTESYESDPAEIDAYNYQKEFILSQYKGHGNEYSDNAVIAMMQKPSFIADNVQNLSQYGYKAI